MHSYNRDYDAAAADGDDDRTSRWLGIGSDDKMLHCYVAMYMEWV